MEREHTRRLSAMNVRRTRPARTGTIKLIRSPARDAKKFPVTSEKGNLFSINICYFHARYTSANMLFDLKWSRGVEATNAPLRHCLFVRVFVEHGFSSGNSTCARRNTTRGWFLIRSVIFDGITKTTNINIPKRNRVAFGSCSQNRKRFPPHSRWPVCYVRAR